MFLKHGVGLRIYFAKEDDDEFRVEEKLSHRRLIKKCKEKRLRGYMTMTSEEMCDVLNLPKQKKNKICENMKKPVEVSLVGVKSGETQKFKSIYSAAKFLGRNPGSVTVRKNTDKVIKSVFDNTKYTVKI